MLTITKASPCLINVNKVKYMRFVGGFKGPGFNENLNRPAIKAKERDMTLLIAPLENRNPKP